MTPKRSIESGSGNVVASLDSFGQLKIRAADDRDLVQARAALEHAKVLESEPSEEETGLDERSRALADRLYMERVAERTEICQALHELLKQCNEDAAKAEKPERRRAFEWLSRTYRATISHIATLEGRDEEVKRRDLEVREALTPEVKKGALEWWAAARAQLGEPDDGETSQG